MRAVRYYAVGQPPQVVTAPVPEPARDGVVIRVNATGVCRSDWHAWQGHDPVPLPMIPGHEFAGVISAVGPGVRGLVVGQRVTVPFVVACGRCSTCLAGDAQVCPHQTQPGFTHDGSFAEFVAVAPADYNVVPLPSEVDDATAAILGCRLATSYRALVAHGKVQDGQWVAVHGAGGVGLSALLIARAMGARVVVTDVSDAALELARRLGAEQVINVRGLDPVPAAQAVADACGGGAHVSVEAIGLPAVAQTSVRCLRRRGSHVQVGLLLGEDAAPSLPMDLVVAQELSIHGSHGLAAADYPALLDLIASGRLDPSVLVARTIGLVDAPAALEALGEPGGVVGMTVVDPRR